MKTWFSACCLQLLMLLIRLGPWRRLQQVSKKPLQTQQAVLMRILQQQSATAFGKEHGFASINSIEEFRQRVGVQRYEELRPWIERQDQTGEKALNAERVVAFTLTSGTTDKPKLIPVTRCSLQTSKRMQQVAAWAIHTAFPAAWIGKVLAIVGPAKEGVLPSGTAFGSMSGLVYQSLPALLKTRYVVPEAVFAITDYEQKYRQICLHALKVFDLTMIATANPSTLLKLERTLEQHGNALVAEIAAELPERAATLASLLQRDGRLHIATAWPQLACVTLWTGGSCKVLLPAIKSLLPTATRLVELGYLASELRGSVTVDAVNNIEIPTLEDHFLEFVEKEAWENHDCKFLTLDQLQMDRQYYIFPTTACGLYRYDINDIIEVSGFWNSTPTIRFVQKGKGILNLTGEKLTETQLIAAVERCARQQGAAVTFFLALGDQKQLHYTLYLQHAPFNVADLDTCLGEFNVEYAAKRASGRLQALRICWLQEGCDEAYKQHCLERGQRESQFKLARLQYAVDCRFDFSPFVRITNHATE